MEAFRFSLGSFLTTEAQKHRNSHQVFLCFCVSVVLFIYPTPLIASQNCRRIVSFSPSLTEIVIALGLKDNLVGVSSYDQILESDISIPAVGDLFSVHTEKIATIKPTVGFILKEQSIVKEKLSDLNIRYELFEHRSVSGIHESISRIAKLCGVSKKGELLNKKLKDEAQSIVKQTTSVAKRDLSRVMVVIGLSESGLKTKKLFISGRDGFFYELLKMLKLEPVYGGLTQGVQALQPEALFTLRPDFIFHVVPPKKKVPERDKLLQLWDDYSELPAVKNKRVFARSETYFSLPGIHYPKVLKAFYETFRGSLH